jgi:hypothetical protein
MTKTSGTAECQRYRALETTRLELPALWPSVDMKSP